MSTPILSRPERREFLASNLLDAQNRHAKLRSQLAALVPEAREAEHEIRITKARLEQVDYLDSIEDTFGPEVAAVVDEQVTDR